MGPTDPIVRARAWLCDLPVETVRTDALQTFVKQETIFVELEAASGIVGLGYSYTIGTGGPAVLSMLRATLLDSIIGADIHSNEAVWRAAFHATRATMTGAITALALAAIDTAVWDAKCRGADRPLWQFLGGARTSAPVYDTEGGWLHLSTAELVEQAIESKQRGLCGIKIKIGKPQPNEDAERLRAVRDAVGPAMHLMVDANQSLTLAGARRRAALFADLDLFWLEEPLPADDIEGHRELARSTAIPLAVGESMYAPAQFKEYLQRGATSIVQVDVARIGGITPWLKVARLAETYNVDVSPHFLMELHLPLVCAISNGLFVEHIPQLRAVTTSDISIVDGHARPSDRPGLGIDWDHEQLKRFEVT